MITDEIFITMDFFIILKLEVCGCGKIRGFLNVASVAVNTSKKEVDSKVQITRMMDREQEEWGCGLNIFHDN